MRVICCLFLLLPACTAHVVRCDGPLQPINPPAAAGTASGVHGAASGAPGTGAGVNVPPRRVP